MNVNLTVFKKNAAIIVYQMIYYVHVFGVIEYK